MAKKDKTEKPAKKEPKEKKPAMAFDINDLAEELDIEASTARIQLRRLGTEKAEESGRYGWKTKGEMMAVVKEIKANKGTKKKAKAKDEEETEEDDDE